MKAKRCPFARWDPDGATPGPTMTPTQAILHVTTAERDSKSHDGLEWHFEIDYDGNIEQSVECDRQAAANYKANVRAISIETWGLGDGLWTSRQINSILKLIRWLNVEWGLPLHQTRKWDAPGFGYHILWGTPGYWTNVAKACPGKNRIKQYNEIIRPALENGLGDVLETTTEESQVMADVLSFYLIYLGITTDEIMNSSQFRNDVSYHAWQVYTGQGATQTISAVEKKRQDIEAWARGAGIYPNVPEPGWWKK